MRERERDRGNIGEAKSTEPGQPKRTLDPWIYIHGKEKPLQNIHPNKETSLKLRAAASAGWHEHGMNTRSRVC